MTNAAIQTLTPRTLTRAARPQKAKHGEGSITWHRGKLIVRLSLGSLGRRAFPLPASTTEREADERRAVMAEMARELGEAGQIGAGLPLLKKAANATDARGLQAIVALARKVARGEAVMKPGSTTTIRELGERWTSGELARLYPAHVRPRRHAGKDAGCLARHVYPVAGDLHIEAFTRDHADEIMRRIPRARAANTVRNVALTLHRLLVLAVSPLRLIPSNPLGEKFIPRAGEQKAKVYLYPDEDRKLLANVGVPLARRVFYGVLAREGMRAGEALALQWSHVDLERGAVRLDTNKTDDPRAWALDAAVKRALVAWRASCEKSVGHLPDLVFEGLKRFGAARMFRADLRTSGITRPELFERSKARKPIRVHDLRAGFVTLALAGGKNEGWIMDRTGHKSSQMIACYRRGARTAEELHLGTLAPLDEAIPELRPSPREPSGERGNGAVERRPEDAGEGPRGRTPRRAERTEGESSAIQILDPPIGSTEPKPGPDGREPSSANQIPAEMATSQDGSEGGAKFLNRWSAVQLCPGSLIDKGPKHKGKRADAGEGPRTGNVRPDPIWNQSAPAVTAPAGFSAPPVEVEPDAAGHPDALEPAARYRPDPPPARVAMVRALAEGMADSFAAGDHDAVKLALETIGRLVAG